ncbi:unnamed protein product [Hydatigera taeniaeformis]|uniref:KH_dom_type_1 domain-containing protein n=1 Tax=Hydatigena taeniaeformis TaxID=6205 RepID=A0A0R3X313_HYDTA|nr:unnamed protein product [Hydatigera taeniaeformis]
MNCTIPVELVGSFGEAYPGYLVDYKAPDSFVFRFAEEFPGFPAEITVLPTRLRKPPKYIVNGTKESDVSVGDLVEVLAGKSAANDATDALPPSWWPARITKRRGDFAIVEFITCEGVPDAYTKFPKPRLENGVEINQVRHKNSEKLLSESDFLYHIFNVPQELVGLFKEPANIEHIVRACGQSMLFCQISEDMELPPEFSNANISEASLTKFLVVCTSMETKLKAETINHDVIRMLRQKHSILHQISELSRRLKEVNSVKSDDFVCAEFSVEKDLVGHSIGAGGANIRRARSVDGIVSVILNPDTCTFKVTGKTKEAVENAKKLLEYATEAMQVPQQYVGRIVGQKNHQIQALVDRVGLARIRVQAANEVTVPNCVPFAFTGTRSAINDAKILINFITDNLKEIDQLQAKITPHEYNRFNNGDGSRFKRRDPSSKSESAKGELTFRSHHTDSGHGTDNGLTAPVTFNGDAGGRFRSGRGTDTCTEHSDSTSFRNSRPSTNRRRRNHLQSSRGGGNSGKPSSPPRQKSLPPPPPKTEPVQQSEVIPRQTPRHHDGGGRRGKGGNRNQADVEGVSVTNAS